MSQNLKKLAPILDYASRIKNKKTRKNLLYELGTDQNIFNAVKETLVNANEGNLKLNKQCKCQLRKDKHVVCKFLSTKKISKKKKREAVSQVGGFLPLLLPIVLGEIFDLIKK